VYIVFAVAVFASGSIDLPTPEQNWTLWIPPQSKYTSVPGMVQSLPLFVFSFGCAINVPTIILELEVMTLKQIDAMIILAISISTGIYMLVGVCGAMAFGASVEGNSLKSFPNDDGVGGLLSIFARLAIVLAVMGGIPLYMYPFRVTISEMVFEKDPKELHYGIRIATAVLLFGLVYGLAMVVQSVEEVMALVGSTSMMLIGFSFPALFYALEGRRQNAESEYSNFGVVVQDLARGDAAGLQPRQSPLRKSAWITAIVTLVLVPILLAGEIYKMATGQGH
jgi:amino acid permease